MVLGDRYIWTSMNIFIHVPWLEVMTFNWKGGVYVPRAWLVLDSEPFVPISSSVMSFLEFMLQSKMLLFLQVIRDSMNLLQ